MRVWWSLSSSVLFSPNLHYYLLLVCKMECPVLWRCWLEQITDLQFLSLVPWTYFQTILIPWFHLISRVSGACNPDSIDTLSSLLCQLIVIIFSVGLLGTHWSKILVNAWAGCNRSWREIYEVGEIWLIVCVSYNLHICVNARTIVYTYTFHNNHLNTILWQKCFCLWSFEQNKAAYDEQCSPGEFKSSAVIRALEVRSKLEQEFPSFVKSLVRSHVASCFWMVGYVKMHDLKLNCIVDTIIGISNIFLFI